MPYVSKTSIDILQEEDPNIQSTDINNLLEIINNLHDEKRKQYFSLHKDDVQLNSWIPSKSTVLESLRAGVGIGDIHYCILDFIEFSNTKGWSIEDNLDSKFITHIKIMEQKGKINLQKAIQDELF